MRVFLDGRLIDSEGTTLGSAIERALGEARGRMLVEVLADGRAVDPRHLDDPPAVSPYAGTLEIRSEDAASLIAETLRGVVEVLHALRAKQEAASRLIQEGKVTEALPAVSEVVGMWEDVRRAIELSLHAAGPAGYHEETGRALTSAVAGLADSFSELKRALSDQDWAGVSDVLGWTLCEGVDSCRVWVERAISGRV